MSSTKEVEVANDLAVRRLIARYSQLVDDGDLRAAAALFAEDGRFHVMGEDLRGRDAIHDWLGRSITRVLHHSVSNVVVSNGSSDGTFHAVSDVACSTRSDNGSWSVIFLGRYHDTMTGRGREMRFTQRILKVR